jgi:hypothetical protein
MQDLKIEVKVSLPSGASVGLTDTQHNKIKSFVSSILFTEPEKTKRAYTRKPKYKVWTKEEDNLLIPLLTITDAQERTKYYKKIKRELNRNSGSIYSRLHTLKNKYISIPVITNYL